MQTKLGSLIEANVNTFVGLGINVLCWYWPIPWLFGMEASHSQIFGLAVFFTFVSVLRGYLVRRWFNWRLKKKADKDAEFQQWLDETPGGWPRVGEREFPGLQDFIDKTPGGPVYDVYKDVKHGDDNGN